jgi:hypothetical protein
MLLEKIAQSLIKGSIHIFEAFPNFTVPLIVKMDFSCIKIHALLDFEAFAYFMDKDFVDRHKLPLVTKKHAIPVEIIDGGPLVLKDVSHKTTLLDIVLERHHSIIRYIVIKSPSNPIVLGLFWLNKYNLAIDWKTQRLVF